MSELKPCPFCWGEAYTVHQDHLYWAVECHDCASHTGLYAKKRFAIEAWNTRAERTCYSDNEPEILYNDKWHVFRCSECHNKVDLCRNSKPNFCPNCGARVVGGDAE